MSLWNARRGIVTPHAALFTSAGGGGGSDEILLEIGDLLLYEAGGGVVLNTGIPAQSSASALTGAEWTVIVQGGTTKKVATSVLAEYING
jgi:hypothetical protein